VRKADDLLPKVMKIRSLNLPDPQGPAEACSGKTLSLPINRKGRFGVESGGSGYGRVAGCGKHGSAVAYPGFVWRPGRAYNGCLEQKL
jgi:hypothetical protein